MPAHFGGALVAELLLSDPGAAASGWSIAEVQAQFHEPVTAPTVSVTHHVAHEGRSTRTTVIECDTSEGRAATLLVGWARSERLARLDRPPVEPAPPPAVGPPGALAAFVDWRCPTGWPARETGRLDAWIRPTSGAPRADFGALDPAWFAVAGDLLAPAVMAPGESVRVATVSLQLLVVATASPGWFRQHLAAERQARRATGAMTISLPDGRPVARVAQSAILLPAEAGELPTSATAFGWGGPVPAEYSIDSKNHAIS